MPVRAVWHGATLAVSDSTRLVEGNLYFPPDSVDLAYLTKTRTHTLCPWKGIASYYTVTVNGEEYRNAAWYYPHPSPLARKIKNYVAFYGGIEIVEG